ncbi:MAG: TrgA family protein [Pseudomonadota bacterium]
MPTAPKLVAALLFALLTWVVSGLFKQQMPEGTQAAYLAAVNCALALILGWRITGSRAGDGMVAAIGVGITTVFAIAFYSILAWAAWEMQERAWKMAYVNPMEALQDMADLMLEYGTMLIDPGLLGTMFIGGIIAAALTEVSATRWA